MQLTEEEKKLCQPVFKNADMDLRKGIRALKKKFIEYRST